MQFTLQCVGTLVRSESAHFMQEGLTCDDRHCKLADIQYIPRRILAFRLTAMPILLSGEVMTNEWHYTGVALYAFHTHNLSMFLYAVRHPFHLHTADQISDL